MAAGATCCHVGTLFDPRDGAAVTDHDLAVGPGTWREGAEALRIAEVTGGTDEAYPMGSRLPVTAALELGELSAHDVLVELRQPRETL